MNDHDWNPDRRPTWPPSLGLLAPDWMALPRAQWTASQWREYAERLEKEGHLLTMELERSQAANLDFEARLRRGKADAHPALSLLDAYDKMPQPRRRGRPNGSDAEELAKRALFLQAEMKLKHLSKKVTNQEAVSELRRRDGRAHPWRVSDETVLNAMSRFR